MTSVRTARALQAEGDADGHGAMGLRCARPRLQICILLFLVASFVSSAAAATVFVGEEGVRVDSPLVVQDVDVGSALWEAQAMATTLSAELVAQETEMDQLNAKIQELTQNLTDTNAVVAEQDILLAQQAVLLAEQAALITSLQSYDVSNTAHLLVIEAAAAALALRVSAEEANITVLTSEVEVMQLAVRVLNGTITTHTEKIADLTATTEAHEEAISGLRQFDAEVTAELTTLKANATILLERVAADEVAAAALQVRVTATAAEILLIKDRLTAAETTEAALTETQANHTASIQRLDVLTAAHATAIYRLETDVLALEEESRALMQNDITLNATLLQVEADATSLARRVSWAENLQTDSSDLVVLVMDLLRRTNSVNESLLALQAAITTANSSLVAVIAAEQAAVTELTTRITTVDSTTTELTAAIFYNVSELRAGISYVESLINNFHFPKMYRHTFLTSTTWTVPAGVSGAFVTMAGGGGSGFGWRIYNSWQTGHSGGYVLSEPITLVGGETIEIIVGKGGQASTTYASRFITTGSFYLWTPPLNGDPGLSGFAGTSTVLTSPSLGELIRCDGGSGGTPFVLDAYDGGTVAGNQPGATIGSGVGTIAVENHLASGPYASSNGPGACGPGGWGIGNPGQQSYAVGSGSWAGGSTPIGYGGGGELDRIGCYVTDTVVGQCTNPYAGRDGAVFIDVMY